MPRDVFRNGGWRWRPRRYILRSGVQALDASQGLVGQSVTTAVGTINRFDATLVLTGQSATSDVGTVNEFDITLASAGQSATTAVGSLDTFDATLVLTGQSATTDVGTINEFAATVAPAGVEASTEFGTPSMGITSDSSVAGVSATTATGTVQGDQPTVPPTGLSVTAQSATQIFRDDTGTLFGVQALAQINTDFGVVFKNIDLTGVFATASAFIIGGLAAGGGGGGASGPNGAGRRGVDGSGTGTGGAGGEGDNGTVPAQTTPSADGNSGTEFDGVIGIGSGGAGASFGDNIGGNGGQYGGGGGGGTGGGFGIGGDAVVVLRWLGSGAIWKEIVLNVADNVNSPLIMPVDWSNTNFVYILSSGGCGSSGSHLAGGNGGGGGSILWGPDVPVFAPGQSIIYHISSGCEEGFTTFGDYAVENGKNATNTAAGLAGTHYTSWPGGIFTPSEGGSTGYSGTGLGGDGGSIFAFEYHGSAENPLSVFATAELAQFSLAGVPGDRVFIITGITQTPIAAGIVMLPTSEDIALGASHYVIGSSQYYTVGEVHWNGAKRVQGVDWTLVSPFSHIITIPNTAGITTPIRLVYYRWDIGIRQGFKVNSYPVSFAFTGTSIVAERVPPANQFFTVEYTAPRPGINPVTMFARYPTIVDDLLTSHTLYDGTSGFETFRPAEYRVFDTSDNKIYTWDGAAWTPGAVVADATKFYVKRHHAIYELTGGSVVVIYTAGDPLTLTIPEALEYPLFGESIGKNLLVDAFSPNAATLYPSAYEIAQCPGDFDEWATG